MNVALRATAVTLAIAGAALAAGCAAKHHSHGTVEEKVSTLEEQMKEGAIILVNNPVCPVMGDEIESLRDAPTVDYKGYRVSLCCSGCVKKFAEDPDTYLAKAQESVRNPKPAQ